MVDREYNLLPPSYPYSEDNFDGYQAAPLRLVGADHRKDLRRRQDRLGLHFALLAREELADYARPKVIDFVGRAIVSRMHQREGLNGINYHLGLSRQHPRFDLAPERMSKSAIKTAVRRSRNGGATPFQNHVTRRVSQSGAAELANLTVIGERRKELEIPMWEDISELVGHDASPTPDDVYRTKILGFDDRDIRSAQHIGAVRLNMKRFIGYTEDGAAVKARTTAIINTSPASGFDQSIFQAMQDVQRHSTVRETSQEELYDEIVALPQFKLALSWLIRSELPAGLVLARNETVYEEHAETRKAIAKARGFGVKGEASGADS